ncbi:MAG: ATP-binding protein, partial [Hyphomicrobiaceae bacterium]
AAKVIEGEVGTMNAQVARSLASARAIGPRAQPGTRTDIAAVIDRLVAAMRKLSVDAPAAWSVSVPPDLPPVSIDRRDVEDMLGNLLDNARKWARSRVGVVVRLEEGKVVVVVDDDGPGIPAEQLDDVLARGTRLDRAKPGTGVGLSIVKDLTELNRGELTLSQGQSGGLRAELRLPSSNRT